MVLNDGVTAGHLRLKGVELKQDVIVEIARGPGWARAKFVAPTGMLKVGDTPAIVMPYYRKLIVRIDNPPEPSEPHFGDLVDAELCVDIPCSEP